MRQIIQNQRVVPILVADDATVAVHACEAVLAAGVPFVEIVLRGPHGMAAIGNASRALPEMRIGGGTVITLEQCKEVIDAGASFIVTPGFDEAVVAFCLENEIPVLPGCLTPTEIQRAVNVGLQTLKFFPAIAMGGSAAIQMYAGPFPEVRFIPTGGLSSANLGDYLRCTNVAAVGGAWMFSGGDALGRRDYAAITANLKRDFETMDKQLGSIEK